MLIKEIIPGYYNIYVEAESLPDIALRRKEYEPESKENSPWPGPLNFDGSKFAISCDKPSRFTVPSEKDYDVDVLVEVQSALFKIIGARRSWGVTSQLFHILKPKEALTFEVGWRDLSNVSFENIVNAKLCTPAGFLKFTLVRSFKKDDSDESWGFGDTKTKKKKKLAEIFLPSYPSEGPDKTEYYDEVYDEYYTIRNVCHCEQTERKLLIEASTEDIKKVKRSFAEALLKEKHDWIARNQESKKVFVPKKEIMEEDEKIGKEKAEYAKVREEAKKQAIKEAKKKNRKKCVIS